MIDIILRPGTVDRDVWVSITQSNEYRLPEDMVGWHVIDIGAHIGAFTYACIQRHARLVYSYECHPENFKILHDNIHPVRSVDTEISISNHAVWGNIPEQPDHMTEWGYLGTTLNTGGSGLVCSDIAGAINIYTDRFDTVIYDMCMRTSNIRGRVDLVKLDCEGSEWPILLTSTLLDLCDRIYGEYHENHVPCPVNGRQDYKVADLVSHLEKNHFNVEIIPHGLPEEGLGMFFATNVSSLSSLQE